MNKTAVPYSNVKQFIELQLCSEISAPASPIWRGGLPLFPSTAAPLPFLSCPLSYFNSRHKTLHFGENFLKIGPKLKKVINVKRSVLYVLYF